MRFRIDPVDSQAADEEVQQIERLAKVKGMHYSSSKTQESWVIDKLKPE